MTRRLALLAVSLAFMAPPLYADSPAAYADEAPPAASSETPAAFADTQPLPIAETLASPNAAAPAPSSAAIPDPGTDPAGFVAEIAQAADAHAYRLLVIAGISGIVWAARRDQGRIALGRWIPWLKTDRGGATLALATGVLSSIGLQLGEGASPGPGLLVRAILPGLLNGATAAGGVIVARRLVAPKDRAAAADTPAPASSPPGSAAG